MGQTDAPVVISPGAPSRATGGRSIGLLLVSLLLVVIVAASGGVLTSLGLGPWYAGLVKPAWNPPSWVFGPVWTTLYVLIAVAAWLVAREPWTREVRRALVLHGIQLIGQVAWSGLFFAARQPLLAAIEIVLLALASVATLVAFGRIRRAAGILVVPYVLWVSFASVLSCTLAVLNR